MSKKTLYFGPDVDKAILEYNKATSQDEKNKIFSERILYPFNKLTEYLYNTLRVYYIDASIKELQSEVIEFILDKLDRYDETMGPSFSYYNVVVMNYLKVRNNKAYSLLKMRKTIDEVDIEDEIIDSDALTFFDIFINYLDNNLDQLFPKKTDYKIASSIITIIKRREHIDILNKKALYVLIREMTDCKSPQITRVVNIYKKIYKNAYLDYIEHDSLKATKNYKKR